ncbi:MAG: Crp/Fnr family transcriptional regulator [Chloroflexota bacterium]|nr:Crp/Fnr family transcriptional regulator [Chloroflexota bacterium]
MLRSYARGDVIYTQDEPASQLFYIIEGRVRIYILSPDGRERTFLIVGAGDLLGDVSFYLDSKTLANAEAFDKIVYTYQIAREGFDLLLDESPELSRTLLASLAQKTRWLAQEIADQSFHDVRGRVQVALIRLAGQHGTLTKQGITIDMRITHDELAKLVGANRATVSACLSELQRDGFYQVVDQRIVLAPWAAGQLLPP